MLELLGYKPGAATEQQQKDDKAQEKGKKPTNPEMRQPANERVSRNVMPPMGAVKNK